MSRPKKSRQLSPLVIPLVAGGLTLLLVGIVLFFSLNVVKEVPVPGPTITISAPATDSPSSPEGAPVTPSQPNQDDTVSQPVPPPAVAPQEPQGPLPVNPQPEVPAPQQQPAPQEPQPVVPAPPVEQPGIIEEAAKVGEAILCSLFCPL